METSVAAIQSRLDHWAALSIGAEWFAAGQSLAEYDKAAATQAYIWARSCYSQYQQAWENSSASRWDPDALDEIAATDTALAHLQTVATELPDWAIELLRGVVPDADPAPDQPVYLQKLSKIATEFRALA